MPSFLERVILNNLVDLHEDTITKCLNISRRISFEIMAKLPQNREVENVARNIIKIL